MKKIFVLIMCGVLLATSAPTYSSATSELTVDTIAVGEPLGDQKDPSDEALQKAIVTVKEKVTIPDEYTDFNYYFYDSNSYQESYWNLSWTDPKLGSSIVVGCDLDYNINYFYKYEQSDKSAGIAKYLKSELQNTAEDFLKKIAPKTTGNLEFVDSEYGNVYSGEYVYNYQRVSNGVAFPDNTASVYVNSITGQVTSASINWIYDVTIPTSSTKTSQAQATALIKENMKMKLVYKSNNYSIYDKNGQPTTEAFLVYEPTENYISVDAKTGKVYTTRTEWQDTDKEAETAATADEANLENGKGDSSVALTAAEIAKIEELKNLISKAKAIKLVTDNTSLFRDNNLTKQSATLNQWSYGTGDSKYVWNVTLSDPREVTEKDYYRGYAYATVDAETGKLLSYHASMKSNYNDAKQKWNTVTIKYDKAQSKVILEKFLKAQMNDHFSNSVLASQEEDYVAYYDKKEEAIYGGYSYQYNRVNSGIEYPDNNIYGSVDGVTGKIYSFGSYWNENVTFESADKVITADQAMNYYLGKEGYGLKYEINEINLYSEKTGTYTVKNEIRLVYRPDINPAYISPFTGDQLYSNGEVYTKAKPYVYKDIENTPANRNILLLADMNIGFTGDNFLPNQNITLGEIKTLLTSIGYGYATIVGDDGAQITNEELAQLFINWLGLEKVSKLKVYATGYYDENLIDPQYIGAVALAKGFGIMTANTNNFFNPKNHVTRFDSVNLLMNFINAQQQGVYY